MKKYVILICTIFYFVGAAQPLFALTLKPENLPEPKVPVPQELPEYYETMNQLCEYAIYLGGPGYRLNCYSHDETIDYNTLNRTIKKKLFPFFQKIDQENSMYDQRILSLKPFISKLKQITPRNGRELTVYMYEYITFLLERRIEVYKYKQRLEKGEETPEEILCKVFGECEEVTYGFDKYSMQSSGKTILAGEKKLIGRAFVDLDGNDKNSYPIDAIFVKVDGDLKAFKESVESIEVRTEYAMGNQFSSFYLAKNITDAGFMIPIQKDTHALDRTSNGIDIFMRTQSSYNKNASSPFRISLQVRGIKQYVEKNGIYKKIYGTLLTPWTKEIIISAGNREIIDLLNEL